jgi:hypothetical protein
MEEPLTLIQRINRVNYFADQIMTALNNPEKRDAFLNKDHSGYRQSTVDAVYLTFSRLKQEILQEKEQANPNEFHLLDELMAKLNHILAIFEPIANKSKTEGGSRSARSRSARSRSARSRSARSRSARSRSARSRRDRRQKTKKTRKYGRKRKTKKRKNI